MSKVLIRYTVRPGEVRENIRLLAAFFEELRSINPPNLSYETYVMEDGLTFVNIVDSATGASAFRDLASYRRHRDTVAARCSSPPEMVALTEIGSYVVAEGDGL